MVIFEYLYLILYVLLIIVISVLLISLAIPGGLLFGAYYGVRKLIKR